MRWFKPNMRSSFYALLARIHPPKPESTVLQYTVDGIREAMLELVGDAPEGSYLHLARRICCAIDAHALWYLRGDLMALLAGRQGEAIARVKIDSLSEMLEEFLPRGLQSRPSPLNSLGKTDE